MPGARHPTARADPCTLFFRGCVGSVTKATPSGFLRSRNFGHSRSYFAPSHELTTRCGLGLAVRTGAILRCDLYRRDARRLGHQKLWEGRTLLTIMAQAWSSMTVPKPSNGLGAKALIERVGHRQTAGDGMRR